MIISHRHRFIFMKSKKTAGTSIEIALSRQCGPDDVITALPAKDELIRAEVGGLGRQHNTSPPLPRPVHEHSPARVAREAVGEQVWSDYLTFVVDRNPWDAVVSLYFWVNRHDHALTFQQFLHQPQVENLAVQNYRSWHIRGQRAVDRVLRYDTLAADLDAVWNELGLPGGPDLPQAKAGLRPGRGYREMYDDAGRDHVAHLFARVIDELGYEF
ncbi:MAG: hypothetical protein WB767_17715 [Nocardioides sp.]